MKKTSVLIISLIILFSNFVFINTAIADKDDWYIYERGFTYNIYRKGSVDFRLESHSGFINYKDKTGSFYPIDCNFSMLPEDHPAYQYGYRAGVEQGIYSAYFKRYADENYPVCFAYSHSSNPTIHTLRSQLMSIAWADDRRWDYEILQNVLHSKGEIDGNIGTYPNVFTGTDAIWSYGTGGLKEEIVMSNITKNLLQSNPPTGGFTRHTYLMFITKLDYTGLIPDGETGDFTSTDGITFRDALGVIRFVFPIGYAYEKFNEENSFKLTYRVIQHQGENYLLSGIKASKLNTLEFPVIIDPSTTIYSDTADGVVYGKDIGGDYWAARNKSIGDSIDATSGRLRIGQRQTARIYRSYLYFDTSGIDDNATITDATLSLYGNYDYSDLDFSIIIQNGTTNHTLDKPLTKADYNLSNLTGNGGSFNTFGFAVNAYNDITLNATGLGWINLTDWTELCLRSNLDIVGFNNSGTKSYVYVRSADDPNKPKLSITYTVDVDTWVDSMGSIQVACPVTITASSNSSELDNVSLWYQYSNDGVTGWNRTYEYYDDVRDAYIQWQSRMILAYHYQTFTIGHLGDNVNDTFLLNNIDIYIEKDIKVTYVKLILVECDAAGYPKGANIATSDSLGNLDVPEDWAWRSLHFTEEAILEPSVTYGIRFSVAVPMGIGNKCRIGYNTTASSNYLGGYRYLYGMTWPPTYHRFNDDDFLFYVNGSWILWDSLTNPGTSYPWSWSFNFSNSTDSCIPAYYRFASRGASDDIYEGFPSTADASCRYILWAPSDRDAFPLALFISFIGGTSLCFGLLLKKTSLFAGIKRKKKEII